MSRCDTPGEGPCMMACLHRRMMRLHTHSLTYHVFAGVVSRCLPCGFRLNNSALNSISATCSVEFAGRDFLTPGRSWTASIMTWHVSGSVVLSSCAVSVGRGDDGYCLRAARRRRTINAVCRRGPVRPVVRPVGRAVCRRRLSDDAIIAPLTSP